MDTHSLGYRERAIHNPVNFPMSQTWNSQTYAENARFVSELGLPVVDWLQPVAGERILDLGCGDGVLTLKLQNLDCQVMGVDTSPEFVAAAQALGLDARLLDGHQLPFDSEFDAVFSNAALHWMTEPSQVIAGVWRSLKPGGRFVGEFGGAGNVAIIVEALAHALSLRGIDPALVNPWYFPSNEAYQSQLMAQGFVVHRIKRIPRPTPLTCDLQGWLVTFANPFLDAVPVAEHPAFLQDVEDHAKPHLCNSAGNWFADYVRLRFMATKPA